MGMAMGLMDAVQAGDGQFKHHIQERPVEPLKPPVPTLSQHGVKVGFVRVIVNRFSWERRKLFSSWPGFRRRS